MLKHLKTLDEFNEVTSKGTVLVDFFATRCGPCQMLMPELDALAKDEADATILEVDVDEFGEIAAKFNVRAVPTLVLFKDGVAQSTTTGYLPKDSLKRFISK
jgi:thioredoxin 1